MSEMSELQGTIMEQKKAEKEREATQEKDRAAEEKKDALVLPEEAQEDGTIEGTVAPEATAVEEAQQQEMKDERNAQGEDPSSASTQALDAHKLEDFKSQLEESNNKLKVKIDEPVMILYEA